MSLVAHRFSILLNCILQAGTVEKSKQIFKIQHVQIDELPRILVQYTP